MQVIDTHCHLDIIESKGIEVLQVLRDAGEAGVVAVVQIATNLHSSRFNHSLADSIAEKKDSSLPSLFWTAGLHPEAASHPEQIDEILNLIREVRDRPDFVGIGEVGLDYFHTTKYVENQRKALEAHLDLARELSLPVVLHLRDDRSYNPDKVEAMRDALGMVRARPGLHGVLHCYTYGYEEAMPFVEMGWKVSFSGIVTYRNAEVVQDAAARLPLECLMVETDAPFLTPMPHRGKVNEPRLVGETLEFMAALRADKRGENPAAIKESILQNSWNFIHWKNHARP